jgi:3-oxoadipate enol-lactonase
MTTLLAHHVTGTHGPWVLLLHGIGGGAAIWGDAASGTAQALADAGCRAVALDLPGYGDSAALKPCGIACMAQHVLRLADALTAEPVWLLGHSMGGMVAQQFAARHAERLAGLVLACTSAAFGPPGGDWQARFVTERLAPLDAGLGMAGMAARLVPGMLGPGVVSGAASGATSGATSGASEAAQAVMARVPEATYRAVLQAIVDFDLREALAQVRVPTLCLAGEHDPTAPAAVMQRMAGRIAGAEFAVVPGAGHIANVEQPHAFNAAVVSFLRRHAGADSTH